MNTAIVVGCSAYDDADIAPLRYAHRDAVRFAQVLRTTCGLAEEQIALLSDDEADPKRRPTRTNVLRHLTSSGSAGTSADLVYFFFSGHGFQSSQDGAQYLLPIDCVRGALEDTSLRFDSVLRYLRARDPRHVLLFLDACRNTVEGGKSGPSEEVPRIDVTALCPSGTVSFCSCEPGHVSYESDGLGAGIFTTGLCEALSDSGRCRTIYELDAFLTAKVPEIAAAQAKPRQRPYTRVEPLGVQQLEIVSDRKRNQWRATTPIGAERRVNVAKPGALVKAGGEPILGIDFGTSYSAVSWPGNDGQVVLASGANRRFLTPSVLHFLPDLDYLVGSAAEEADQFRPVNTIHHVKRVLGTATAFEIEGRSIAPELAASLVIRSLRRNAEDALGVQVRRCVAAYPANFSLAQRNALQRAFELADLDVTRMLGEPNVAALTLDRMGGRDQEATYLIIDLGGGTFDVAVVETGEGVYELKAAGGSSTLGGLDYDAAVIRYTEDHLRGELGLPDGSLDPLLRAQLRREAVRVKRELGIHATATLILQDVEAGISGMRDISVLLDREMFRDLTRDLNEEIRLTIEQVIADWREVMLLRDNELPDAVMLAGQGAKIFTVGEQLDALGFSVPYLSEYQETAVVQGLGLQAGVFAGKQRDALLLDIAQDGIGVRCRPRNDQAAEPEEEIRTIAADPLANSDVILLIGRNTSIPTKRSDIFRFEETADEHFTLEFVEARAKSIETIGQVRVPAGTPGSQLEITIDIDANSTILASIIDLTRGEERSYQLNNLYRIKNDLPLEDQLAKALGGYAVWPIRPITQPEPPPGTTYISAGNADALLHQLDGRIAHADPNDAEIEGLLTLRGLAHEVAGHAAAAEADYIRALGVGKGYRMTAAVRLAVLLPELADRTAAVASLRDVAERGEKQPFPLILRPLDVADALHNAGEHSLANRFAAIAHRSSHIGQSAANETDKLRPKEWLGESSE